MPGSLTDWEAGTFISNDTTTSLSQRRHQPRKASINNIYLQIQYFAGIFSERFEAFLVKKFTFCDCVLFEYRDNDIEGYDLVWRSNDLRLNYTMHNLLFIYLMLIQGSSCNDSASDMTKYLYFWNMNSTWKQTDNSELD